MIIKEYNKKIIDDYDKKEIKTQPFTLNIDNSELSRRERFFKLFLKKKDLHFRSLKNLRAYIKKHKLTENEGLRIDV